MVLGVRGGLSGTGTASLQTGLRAEAQFLARMGKGFHLQIGRILGGHGVVAPAIQAQSPGSGREGRGHSAGPQEQAHSETSLSVPE